MVCEAGTRSSHCRERRVWKEVRQLSIGDPHPYERDHLEMTLQRGRKHEQTFLPVKMSLATKWHFA